MAEKVLLMDECAVKNCFQKDRRCTDGSHLGGQEIHHLLEIRDSGVVVILVGRVLEIHDRRHPVIIALTGFGRPEDTDRVKRAEFDYYIVKPADIIQLRKRRLVRFNTLGLAAWHRSGAGRNIRYLRSAYPRVAVKVVFQSDEMLEARKRRVHYGTCVSWRCRHGTQ